VSGGFLPNLLKLLPILKGNHILNFN